MDLLSYLPAVAQHGLITHRQALAAGLQARDIALLVISGEWVRLRKGVYVGGETYRAMEPFREAPLLRIRAAGLAMRTQAIFSHDSAAIVLEMGAPDPRTSAIHVARRHHRATITSGGIFTHGALFDAGDVIEVDGLKVLGRARTAIDMTRLHGVWPGMAACDAALRHGVTRAEMEGVAERMRKWPHKILIDRAIALADGGAATYLESLARGLVHDLGIGTPETQFGLSDGTRTIWGDIRVGRQIFEPDGKLKYFLQQLGKTPEQIL